jgi:hypothetical protein
VAVGRGCVRDDDRVARLRRVRLRLDRVPHDATEVDDRDLENHEQEDDLECHVVSVYAMHLPLGTSPDERREREVDQAAGDREEEQAWPECGRRRVGALGHAHDDDGAE